MDAKTKTKKYDEVWADDYMEAERRRNAILGVSAVVAVALLTFALLMYFGSMATTGL